MCKPFDPLPTKVLDIFCHPFQILSDPLQNAELSLHLKNKNLYLNQLSTTPVEHNQPKQY